MDPDGDHPFGHPTLEPRNISHAKSKLVFKSLPAPSAFPRIPTTDRIASSFASHSASVYSLPCQWRQTRQQHVSPSPPLRPQASFRQLARSRRRRGRRQDPRLRRRWTVHPGAQHSSHDGQFPPLALQSPVVHLQLISLGHRCHCQVRPWHRQVRHPQQDRRHG